MRLNPDLRSKDDPELGEYVPIKTKIYYELKVKQSSLGENVGSGVFADESIRKGSVIVVGGGQLTSILTMVPLDKDYLCIFDDKYFMGPLDYDDLSPNWLINHSCDPNTKIMGGLIIIANKDILKGDELFIDYSTLVAGHCDWSMKCMCNSNKCRKIISSDDWKQNKLFIDHYDEWIPYIQKKGLKFIDGDK